jgi:cytoskeleton protein RodZ
MSEKIQQESTNTPSVGKILRQYRQNKNLGSQQVASQLHLEIRVIEALEADDYDNLPDAIYVRGYIRSYAKLVGADADDLIALYDSDGATEAPEIIPEVKHSSQANSSDKPVKAFTYLLTLLLAVLLITWWQSNFLVKKTSEPEPADEKVYVPPAFDYPFDVVIHPDSPFYRYEGPPLEEPGETAATETDGEPPASSTDNGDGGTALSEYTEQSDETESPPSTGPDTITLKVSADSWIEIHDAIGQKVLVDLARAGDTYELHGHAPFSVLLGFAQGVSIELNGKPFDPARYSRSGVARFTLE